MIRTAVIIFLLIAFLTVVKSNIQLFQISSDMAIEAGYIKRASVKPRDNFFPSLVRYSSESAEFLNSIHDSNLLGFRCSDRMLRTSQGVYLLETVKTTTRDKRRIKNQGFIEFMRDKEKSLPKGKKILTARICEKEDKTILLFYSIGRYDIAVADNSPITQTIFNSTDNEAFVQVISNPLKYFFTEQVAEEEGLPAAHRSGDIRRQSSTDGRETSDRIWGINYKIGLSNIFTITRSTAHLRCDELFQIGAGNLLYILCDEQQANLANFTIYRVDLKTGIIRLLRRCENNFSDRLKTVCS